MSLDDLVLALQHLVDRAIRRLRLGPAPTAGRRRLLVVQIDGLSRQVLEQALAQGRMPFVARLLRRGHRLVPMAVGLPTSTPAFQMAVMYGVRPDIPGFHFHDKRRRADVYFPRGGDAAGVEARQAAGRPGILEGGSAYGCVFTGGAVQNLFSFAQIKRPSGAGLLRAVSAFVVLLWVAAKGLTLSVVELLRAALRFLADPLRPARGWKWLAIKVGISVWVRQLFTLCVSRDVYAGVPAIYVNYLDYDVMAHAFGPRHRSALRALRRVDASIHQVWRACRRVPEHGYDLYVLSDHGQALTQPYQDRLGVPLERHLFQEFLPQTQAVTPATPRGRRLAAGIKGYRTGRAPGLFQRFVNYLEEDFPWVLGEVPEARERDGIRIIAAGPNAFVYFLDDPTPRPLAAVERRFPGLVEELSRSRGVGFLLVRGEDGPLCVWRGKRYRLDELGEGPFAGRDDLPIVVAGIRDLMAMPSAGDLVVYGIGAPDGHVSYIPETGAHAGPSREELHTFVIAPAGVALPALDHPLALYPCFARYREGVRIAA
jgi:hypothetical protein